MKLTAKVSTKDLIIANITVIEEKEKVAHINQERKTETEMQ